MSPARAWILGGSVVVLLLAGLLQVLLASGPSDERLIREALQQSLRAGKEGRPGGVVELLSDQLRFNDEMVPNKRQIAQFVRDSRPEVLVTEKSLEVHGDQALMVANVSVRLATPLGISLDRTFEDVQLQFRREPGTRLLVLPDRKWRLYRVLAPNASLSEF
ncbi:MAG: hypothetical protein N2109_00030 [Fimbriimonadales bacterium]|nr:hypothetical protein [Fimbriimonadales bacterium]